MPHHNYYSSDSDCGSYGGYDSCSSSSSDHGCHKKKKRHCYNPPPHCPKPCFGKQLATKLCPSKVVPPSDSCAYGYGNFVLSNSNKCVKYCVKVVDLRTTEKCITGEIHKADPCDVNDSTNLVKTISLKRYPDYSSYNSCKCKYLYVGKGKWKCDDCHDPLTSQLAELLACGKLNLEVEGEVRGQICDYDDVSSF